MIDLIRELKRRKVFKVIGSYAVIAWLIIQIIVSVESPLGLPGWSDTVVIITLLLGFPICAILAWIYDFSTQGIQRTEDQIDEASGRELKATDRWTIVLSVMAAVLLLITSAYLVIGKGRSQPQTLAVLPFVTVSGEVDLRYLGDGVRDSLVTRLSRLQELRIKSTNSGSLETDLVQLGTMLGVKVLCRGRIEEHGNAFEVVAELIETSDGSIIWRDQYSSQTASLLQIEGQIAEEIARQMGFELSEQDQVELARTSTANPAAHRLYLQGRYFWNRRTVAGFQASIEFYEDALKLDPNYALAYAGLADTYLMILGWGIKEPDAVAQQIVDSAQMAIRLDPSLAEPYAALGYFKTIYKRDWDEARDDFLHAIELNNNYSSAHHWYAFLLMTEGNMRSAVQEILLARELEPLSPIINAEVGYFYLFDRKYQKALDALQNAQRLDPNYVSTVNYLARAHALLDHQDEALKAIERYRIISNDNPMHSAYFAMVLPRVGLHVEARNIYVEVKAASEKAYISPGKLGVLAASIGEYDAAVEHFEAALEDRSLVLSWLRDPLLKEFQTDPRYIEFMQRCGLEP
jgi:TolB-like protein/lipoprotein NlpI